MIKITTSKRSYTLSIILALGILMFGILLFGAASVVTWEYTNSNAFCANSCHAVHPEEPVAHQYSQHAKIQ